MATALTREQVLALSPDDASAKAAGGLVAEAKWVTLGADDDAVWGECQGSGSKPYQAQVDLAALVSRCSCPSRKFPCKHALALLLLYAQRHPRFANAARPAWVDEWLASRRDRSEKKEKSAAAEATRAAADPAASAAAAAKREDTRWKRIESGTAELERWIADLLRRGLARFDAEQRRAGAAMAARMIDAQAPGLAPRLQEALELLAGGSSRSADVVARLGLLQLAVEGVRRRVQLSPARLADLRAALGWAPDKEDVLASGEAVQDEWCVLGQIVEAVDDKLSERRVWLQGQATRRHALLQEFSYAGRGWERGWETGASYNARMHYFPGSVPLRALAQDVSPASARAGLGLEDAATAFDAVSQAFASNAWLPQFPLVLDRATPFRRDEAWFVHTEAGIAALRIDEAQGWSLLAFTGGHATSLVGEWNGAALRVLSARDARGTLWTLESAE